MKEQIQDRLRKRAEIRRQITTRKSVQEGKPDKLANLLDEAALYIDCLEERVQELKEVLYPGCNKKEP